MPICDKCGTGLPVGYDYCFKCGYPVRGLPEDEAGTAQQSPPDEVPPDDGARAGGTYPPGTYPPDAYPPPSAYPPGAVPPGPYPSRPPGAPPAWPPPGYQPVQPGTWAQTPVPMGVSLVAQGWPRRFLAFLIDYFVVSVPMGLLTLVVLARSGRLDLARQTSLQDLLQGVARGQQTLFSTGEQTVIAAAVMVALFIYFTVLEGAWGTTLGKRVLGLKVVREAGTGPCGWRPSLVRNAFKVATLLLMPFGLLVPLVSMAIDPVLHRRVGDRVAHTLVVREVVTPAAVWQPPQQP